MSVSVLLPFRTNELTVVIVEDVLALVIARKNSKTTRSVGYAVVGCVDSRSTTLEQVVTLLIVERSVDVLRSSDPDVISSMC